MISITRSAIYIALALVFGLSSVLVSMFAQSASASDVNGPVVTGTVNSPGTTTVTLKQWPAWNQMKEYPVGSIVKWKQVSTTTTTDGAYTLPLNGATGNLMLIATSASSIGSWSFTRSATATGTVTADISEMSHYGSQTRITKPGVCPGGYPKVVRDFGPRMTIVGQTYVWGDAVHQGFTYLAGQSSSLGVGDSVTGAAGSFTGSGTQEVSSNFGLDFPEQPGEEFTLYEASYVYEEFVDCGEALFFTQSTAFAGGAQIAHPGTAPAGEYCQPEPKGIKVTSSGSTAVTWSAGASLPIINFGVSARTGYSTSAEVNYEIHASNRWLCGTNAYPGEAAQLVITD